MSITEDALWIDIAILVIISFLFLLMVLRGW